MTPVDTLTCASWMLFYDKGKTIFITNYGVYNYVMMPFGLKMLKPPCKGSWIRFSSNKEATMSNST